MKTPLLLIALLTAILPGAARAEYATIDDLARAFNPQTCRGCHESVHDEWQKSFHAQSIVHSLGGLRNFIVFGLGQEWKKPVTRENLMRCMGCHAPMLREASEPLIRQVAELIVAAVDEKDTAKKSAAKDELAKLSVNCVICHHTMVAVEKNLRGAPAPGVYYGPRGVLTSDHPTERSAALASSVFCGQCHGVQTQPDGEIVMCNTLYGSYQDGYRGNGGTETCQDCHMRKEKRGHTFPGAYDVEMVREGIGFEVQAAAVKTTPGTWVPTAVVEVELTNRAGHRIPDG